MLHVAAADLQRLKCVQIRVPDAAGHLAVRAVDHWQRLWRLLERSQVTRNRIGLQNHTVPHRASLERLAQLFDRFAPEMMRLLL